MFQEIVLRIRSNCSRIKSFKRLNFVNSFRIRKTCFQFFLVLLVFSNHAKLQGSLLKEISCSLIEFFVVDILVAFFPCKLVRYDMIKNEFSSRNIRKLYYFSDEAGSQYKNRFHLANLLNHEGDFGFKDKWHFFATSLGKGACGEIGGA